ncbi:hypothetical protein PUNSTDRAFT_54242 [Punctularia strigosozonata HHB-11173 SS5]|uniref:uncharacterized protein n=1 Tax=Punctularia strigosozonata (strain HHB-11173) TaxID=741275 RepID=UPI00044168B8|nr:uncharacterized protein PUNSTDRAFT_54242 [Punctularia strigosozonata HHB-11173 SS5]EIN06901.1 hypothetical protein PUNSTDRAFT_54242 [Punctularia strigosozonata HHB-11173 SS5]
MLIDDSKSKALTDASSSRDDDASVTLGGPSIRERPFSQDTTLGQPSIRLPNDPPPSFSSVTYNNPTTAGGSPRRRRFRESLYEIPTPGTEVKRPPRYEPIILRTWAVLLIATIMIVMAIALEIGVLLSIKRNGFGVPEKNAISFASPAFLLSFVPTLLVAPLAFLWTVTDWMIRWYQPYVTLLRGNAPAGESILLDYIALNKIFVVKQSIKHRHWLLTVSTLTALGTILFQPLAGALFELRQTPHNTTTTVKNVDGVGLAPDISTFNAFVAAAGFVEAAVFHNLTDPPFINGSWALAEFKYPPNPDNNALSVSVPSIAINTSANCFKPDSTNPIKQSSGDVTIFVEGSSSFASGCSNQVTLNPNDSEQQYGVEVAQCGAVHTGYDGQGNQPIENDTAPVLFWYYHETPSGQNQAAAVYCAPSITVFNVQAMVSITNGSVMRIEPQDKYTSKNNVTGSPQNGQALNGLFANTDSLTNSFVKARQTATSSGVPGAVFRFAVQQDGTGQSTFSDPNGFLTLTQNIYTQFLAIVAKSVYFVQGTPAELTAELTSNLPRLFMNELAAHGLAAALGLIGIIGIVVHILHRRARMGLHLTAPPGSIAAIVSLTSRSGFGDLLLPYDDVDTIRHKLDGLRFRLDKRTGAIVAEEGDDDDDEAVGTRGRRKSGMPRLRTAGSDDMRMSLLAPGTVTEAVAGAGQRHERMSTVSEGASLRPQSSRNRSSSSSRLSSSVGQPPLGYTDVPYQWEPLPYPVPPSTEKDKQHSP